MNKNNSPTRWFRFRLRTLFVVMTLVACAVGWFVGQVRLVKEREKFQETLFAAGGGFEWTSNDFPKLPWWRERLGDVGVEKVRVPYSCDAEIRADVKRLFPEAELVVLSKEQIKAEAREREKQKRDDEEAAAFKRTLDVGKRLGLAKPSLETASTPAGGKPVTARIDPAGTIHLLFDTNDGPAYATSKDRGNTFSPTIQIVDSNSKKQGLEFHGADMAIGKDGTVHVALSTNAWKLKLPQTEWAFFYANLEPDTKTFSPVRNLNARPSEGFSLAADDNGNVTACWLSEKLYANVSHDNGKTFGANEAIDASFDPCNCCTTSTVYGPDGRLAVLYREETNNDRDMYFVLWDQEHGKVSRTRISSTLWSINACPMSAFALSRSPHGFVAVWPTKDQIYFVRLDNNGNVLPPGEIKTDGTAGMRTGMLGVTAADGTTHVLWKKDNNLGWQEFNAAGKAKGTSHSFHSPGTGFAGVVDKDGCVVLFQ
jgi:hypothetical protein